MGKAVVNTKNDLIAAVPAMLGYAPSERVAFVFLRGIQVLFVAAAPVADFPIELDIIATGSRNGADRVVVIVATDRPIERVRRVVDDIAIQARAGGLELVSAFHVADYAMGARFVDVLTGEQGLLNDPRASVVAAHHVAAGNRQYRSREEIEDRFGHSVEADPAPATSETIEQFAARTLTDVVDAVMLGEPVAPELAARVGRLVVRSRTARDALIGVGAIGAEQAAQVMIDVASQLRGQMRVEVLTVAGIFLYAANEGVAAGVAITTAIVEAQQQHITASALLSLVHTSLAHGIPPMTVRRLISTGVVIADDSYRVFIPEV